MSFLKSLFGSKTPKKLKRTYDPAGLRQIYEEAKELFLCGKYAQALEDFKAIYEQDIGVRDVGEILLDYFDMPEDKWIAKYTVRFRAQPPKQSGDDTGTGSAPVPVPKRPIFPSGSFRAERRPDEDERAA
ncbi:MAG TPA: hypothetical protein VKU37_09545 [Verrucomicrobiae bacterium]|nr:hypothetical protein [Verrucomicrobiae bacterium]